MPVGITTYEHVVSMPFNEIEGANDLDRAQTFYDAIAAVLGQQRLWLHAWQLDVPHPVTGEQLVLHSGLAWPLDGAAQTPAPATPDASDWHRLMRLQPWTAVPGGPDCGLPSALEVHSAT